MNLNGSFGVLALGVVLVVVVDDAAPGASRLPLDDWASELEVTLDAVVRSR